MMIWAKSAYQGVQKTLVEHTTDVMNAFVELFGAPGRPTRLGDSWARFFRLPSCEAFLGHGLAGCGLHDWGKANDGFQRAVTEGGPQLVRHEHLSALLLIQPPVQQWLGQRQDLDLDLLLAAVVSHHLAVSHAILSKELKLSDGERLTLLWNEREFQGFLRSTGERLRLEGVPAAGIESSWSFRPRRSEVDLLAQCRLLQQRLGRMDDVLAEDEPRRRLLWAVRAGIIVADAVGSAQPRLGQNMHQWIAEAFDEHQLLDEPGIWAKVIEPRIRELRALGRWNDQQGIHGWSLFQEGCAALGPRALLLAPCGSGKTLAAWRWIAAQLKQHKAARVIFLYPTRATATEGFRDYVSWAPEADAALVHGTAEYDLEGMFVSPSDSPRDSRQGKHFEADPRLYALRFWKRRIFSATVDQFLAFLQHQYSSACLLPLLADSVVVIDEVHSFDRGVFSALRQLLRTFQVPVLCMTATLPQTRRVALAEDCGLQVCDEKPADLRRIAEHPRYRVQMVADAAQATNRIRQALAAGQRVLWVVNQVKRAQAAALLLAEDAGAESLKTGAAALYCYHSRYRLEDRRRWHREVVAAFQQKDRAALAITTQVCEMSLDLDADLLVTEEAPITALIQRMGRCNRRAVPAPGHLGEVVIYPAETHEPYPPEQLAGVPEFVARLLDLGTVNQVDLEKALEQAPQLAEPPKDCSFLDSGPYALSGEETFRDLEAFTVPAVLEKDIETFVRLDAHPKTRPQTAALVVPVPKRLIARRDPRLPAYLAVAPDAHYLPALGFLDRPLT